MFWAEINPTYYITDIKINYWQYKYIIQFTDLVI